MPDDGAASAPSRTQGGQPAYETPGQPVGAGKGNMEKVPHKICGEAKQHISDEEYAQLQGGVNPETGQKYETADMQDMYERDTENGGWKLKPAVRAKAAEMGYGDFENSSSTENPPVGAH